MKKFLSILVIIAILSSVSVFAFANENVNSLITVEEKKIADDKKGADLLATTEDVADKATKTQKLSFKNAFKDLFNKLDALRAIAKNNWATIKDLNAQIKATLDSAKKNKENKKLLAAVKKGDLASLHTQVKSVRGAIIATRALKSQEWINFRAAVKAKNLESANTALVKIIDYKSQIIDQQKELIKLKHQILDILKKTVK